jgi:hypothetical protein
LITNLVARRHRATWELAADCVMVELYTWNMWVSTGNLQRMEEI